MANGTSSPYVELLPDTYGWVWIDGDNYGHRGPEYTDRWMALGGLQSGWDLAPDGSFSSQLPLGVRGHPIDPGLPAPDAVSAVVVNPGQPGSPYGVPVTAREAAGAGLPPWAVPVGLGILVLILTGGIKVA